MSHNSRKTSGDKNSKLPREGADIPADSRRSFLMLSGAAVVAGLVDACSSSGGITQSGSGGSSGTGGSATGGSATGGTIASGGTSGLGGTIGSGGKTGSGGAPGSGGASVTGGAPGSGGKPGSGGAPGSGGVSTNGGAPGSGGASAGGGAPGSGGKPGSGGVTATGGSGTGGSIGVDGGGGGGGTVKWPAEDTSAGVCTLGTVPTMNNAMLPDPFKLFSGKRIATKEEWTCLRAELSAALQKGVYGPKMPAPDKLTATFSGGKVSMTMTVGSASATYSFSITGGGTKAAPVPGLITCGGSSLPKLSGVAQIDMANNTFASESDLSGIVKTLFGSACAKSGALISWAWGCSRIIDALELCPDAGVDTKHLAVTGCSRNGKGALAMGAFDERVALTLMQEGGSGGSAAWRISSKEKSLGDNIQECGEITGEAKWQGSDFAGFCKSIATLPCDQHFAVALCAPRGVLLIENDIDWLGPVATYGGGIAGRAIFEGLGIKDRCGVSVAPNHSHCSFPSNQQAALTAFVNRFLMGKTTTDTSGVDTFNASSGTSKLLTFKPADWIDWTIPTLTGKLPFDPLA